MISWFRKLTQTWVARLLFLLLVVSFAIWGIEDTVRNFWRETAVVEMEGAEIGLPEAQAAARRELQNLQRQLGPNFQPDETIRRAVANQAIERLIAEHALRAEARALGVATTEEAVRDYVFGIRSFQMGGQFSRALLDQFLRQNDLSEAQFLQIVRDDLMRMQLMGAIRAGAYGPPILAERLYRWEQEQRIAQVAEFPLVEAPELEPPTEAQLARFHANNPDRFSSPEMREVTLAVLSPTSLADQVEVTPDEIAAAYEHRRSEFVTPERRDLEQALMPTQEAARALAETWRGNADFSAIERAAQEGGGAALALPGAQRTDLPIPELAEGVFAAPEGGIVGPVQSPFGWHVMRVARIHPGSTVAQAEVEERLRRDVALEKAADLAYERANRAEDAIAGGASLEDAARQTGMAVATLRIDAQGRDAEGNPVALPVPPEAHAETLRAIFATPPGQAPRLTETQQGHAFVAVEVKSVTPPELRPLETVTEEVRQAYLADARRRHQEEAAARLLGAVRGGERLETAATAQGVRSERFGPVGRQAERGAPGLTIPPELLPGLFNLKPGEATMAETRSGFAVAQLLEVVQADPAAAADAVERLRRETMAAVAEDLEAQYLAALRRRAAPRISPTLMQQVVP